MRITLRVRSEFPSLRRASLLKTFRRASLRARRFGLRIIQFSIEARSLHLICEFSKQVELERSFKSLNTTLAIALKKEWAKDQNSKVVDKSSIPEAQLPKTHKGAVFVGRFFMELLDRADRLKNTLKQTLIDRPSRYSSLLLLNHWKRLIDPHSFEDRRRLHLITKLLAVEPGKSPLPREFLIQITATPRFKFTREAWLG